MQNRSLVLLGTLLRSTSGMNVIRFEKDSKKRGKAVGGYIGLLILYLLLMGYCVLTTVGYGIMGLTSAIPIMCALLITILMFFFTILKTNGYLFAFKGYDMVMSLPLKPSQVAGIKIWYMYIKSLPWVLSISVAMLAGYGIFAKPSVPTYFIWIVLSIVLSIIPMVLASALGALIAGIGSIFKHKQLVQTVLTFILIIVCFSIRFIIESVVKDDLVDDILVIAFDKIEKIKGIYLPFKWFEEAVVDCNIISILLVIAVSAAVFLAFTTIVGKFYRKMNSRLMASAARKNYKMREQKKMSVANTIAFKEFRRLMNSTIYITNVGLGQLFTIAITIAVLFVDLDSIIATITQGAPLKKENLIPAVPFIIYFLLGMMATTACSLSLEGKSLWILKSLPIETKDILKGKMLFNMYITVPFMALASLSIGIKAGASLLEIVLFLVLGFLLCAFSTTYGMRCNLKHPKYDWENEVEVIKQGSSTAIYMLPNMFGGMILVVAVVALGFKLAPSIILCIVSIFFAIIDYFCYKSIIKLTI